MKVWTKSVKIKKSTLYSPDVGEDDRVWISKSRNRAAK